MIQIIGLMIGAYILMRCLSMFTRKGDRAEHSVVRFASAIAFLFTTLMMALLLFSDSSP